MIIEIASNGTVFKAISHVSRCTFIILNKVRTIVSHCETNIDIRIVEPFNQNSKSLVNNNRCNLGYTYNIQLIICKCCLSIVQA